MSRTEMRVMMERSDGSQYTISMGDVKPSSFAWWIGSSAGLWELYRAYPLRRFWFVPYALVRAASIAKRTA